MIKLLSLFLTFSKISLIGFGGGYGIMSIILTEIGKFGITASQFADLIALELVVPGPIAINAATFVGYLAAGVTGATAATLGIFIPCMLLSYTVFRFLDRFRSNVWVQAFLSGVKPAAIGLIAVAAILVGRDVVLGPEVSSIASMVSLCVMGAVLLCSVKFKLNPIVLTILAGVAGALFIR